MSAAPNSESIEYQALDAWFGAVADAAGSDNRWSKVNIADARCFASTTEPSILINRVLGLGAESLPSLEELREIRAMYIDAGISRFFLHVLPERLGSDYPGILTEAGYEKYRSWMKFERKSGPVDEVTTDLSIRKIGPEHVQDFATIVGNAFDFEPAFRPAIAALIDSPDWHLYMSFDGDIPAGTGGLFIRDGVGYLDFGATHPDFRRRGGQTCVLITRIRDALDAGCRSIVTMTGEAVPGDEQHSYRNIQRAGFTEAYLRENWIPSQI